MSTGSSSCNSHLRNFGGLWEAAVKLTKKHLKRIIGNVKLTFEELSTFLTTQIKACLCNKNWTQDIWYGFYALIMNKCSKRRGGFVSPMIVQHYINHFPLCLRSVPFCYKSQFEQISLLWWCPRASHVTVEVLPRPDRRTKVLPEPGQCNKVWRREEMNSTSSWHQETTRCHWIWSG